MENGWAYLRANKLAIPVFKLAIPIFKLAITVFDTHDHIRDKCAQAWNFFAKDPERVPSITDREWIKLN